jgi:hypothetical protein
VAGSPNSGKPGRGELQLYGAMGGSALLDVDPANAINFDLVIGKTLERTLVVRNPRSSSIVFRVSACVACLEEARVARQHRRAPPARRARRMGHDRRPSCRGCTVCSATRRCLRPRLRVARHSPGLSSRRRGRCTVHGRQSK